MLRYDQIEPLLDTLATQDGMTGSGGGIVRPDAKWVFGFFKSWDGDKNGVISFFEFLHRILIALNEKEKARRKVKRRQVAAAKRRKAKEAEAAKQALQQQPQMPTGVAVQQGTPPSAPAGASSTPGSSPGSAAASAFE